MRRISLAVFLVVGAIGVLPDTAEAQIFRRRRARYDCCCAPVYNTGCCGAGVYGGPGFVGGPMPVGYSDCSPGYGGVAYGGPMQGGYAPMPGGEGGPYTAGYPNSAGGQPMPSPSLNVVIRDGAFEPNRINVRVGDTVRWTNNGQKVHTVSADDGSWDSGNLDPGKTYSHKFDKAGTFNYHCEPHKDVMKASITVSDAGNGSVPGAPPPPPNGREPLPKQLDK
jgi:plastocyanin